MKVRAQKWILATHSGKEQKQHVFEGYNNAKGTIIWTTALIKNTTTFIQFLDKVLVQVERD